MNEWLTECISYFCRSFVSFELLQSICYHSPYNFAKKKFVLTWSSLLPYAVKQPKLQATTSKCLLPHHHHHHQALLPTSSKPKPFCNYSIESFLNKFKQIKATKRSWDIKGLCLNYWHFAMSVRLQHKPCRTLKTFNA